MNRHRMRKLAVIITTEVFIKWQIVSVETILSAHTHTHKHSPTHKSMQTIQSSVYMRWGEGEVGCGGRQHQNCIAQTTHLHHLLRCPWFLSGQSEGLSPSDWLPVGSLKTNSKQCFSRCNRKHKNKNNSNKKWNYPELFLFAPTDTSHTTESSNQVEQFSKLAWNINNKHKNYSKNAHTPDMNPNWQQQ